MANYPAPTELLPAFTPSVFETNDTPLTIEEGEKYFLTYPVAQGAQTIPTLSTGTLSVSGTVNITNPTPKATVYGFETTVPTGTGEHNTAFGYRAGRGFSTLTTTGGNTAFGALAMAAANINGATNNTAIGHNSLLVLTTGDENTCVGVNSGNNLTTGSENTCVGMSARPSTSSTTLVVAIGKNAIGVSNNTVIGSNAAAGSGNQCVAVGRSSSCVGANSVTVGDSATCDGASSVSIGRSTTCNGSNSVSLGASSTCAGSNSVSLGAGVSTATSNTITLGTTTETVRYNKVSPLYSSLPTYTAAEVGYTETISMFFSTATATQIGFSTSLPIGTWLFVINLGLTGTFGANEGSWVIKTGYTSGTPASGTIVAGFPFTKTTGTYAGMIAGSYTVAGTPSRIGIVSDYSGTSTLSGTGAIGFCRVVRLA
jgi:hypothetical protein